MNPFLARMLDEHLSVDLSGREVVVTGSISRLEAEFMMALIEREKLRKGMETGVAYGVSTVAICEALSHLGGDCYHWGTDPCQQSDYDGAALAALKCCGLDQFFELLEGPSHRMLPRLLERGVRVDMAFVDGWHTFDYTLLDVFYADKLLRPGGFLLMHDMHMPSKEKVWRFLASHRHYERLRGPARPPGRCVLSIGKATLLLRPKAVLSVMREMRGLGNLLVARKVDDWEPDYNYYKEF